MPEDVQNPEDNRTANNDDLMDGVYFDEYYSGPCFEDEFKGSYQAIGKNFDVTIQGKCGTDSEKDNYYTATYPDGSTKDIDWVIGTGWNERGAGATEHANAIGDLIEQYFSGDNNFKLPPLEPITTNRPTAVPGDEDTFTER